MIVIRLFRAGKRNQPFFKVVVTDKKNASRGGRFIEELGFINPVTKENKIDAERAKYWIKNGAQPSDTIHNLLVEQKVIEGKKIPAHIKKKAGEVKVEVKSAEPVASEPKVEAPKVEEEIK